MSAIVYLIEQIAIGLYIFIGLGIVIAWRNWGMARWARRSTRFELERDIARYHSANALTSIVLLLEVGLIVAGIQTVVAPTVREIDAANSISEPQIITDIEFKTPTPGATAEFDFNPGAVVFNEINPADRIFFTATPRPTPVGTIVSNPPDIIGCDTPNAYLKIPANGMRVFQITSVVGTAFTDNFAAYKLEIKGKSTFDNFASLESGISPVTEDGSLGQFNPAPYEPGLYQFRVVVFDNTDTMRASCTISIYIDDPPPTRTPIPLP